MENQKLVSINGKIATLAKAEKITKAVLGELSRDMLDYIIMDESYDSDSINRLLAVLTPMNKKTAILFFAHFTPFLVDEHGVFGGMEKNKERKAKAKGKSSELVLDFLANEDSTIWTWAEEHVKVEQKPVDWYGKLAKDVRSAMDKDKGGLSMQEVLRAVMDGGISADDILASMGLLYAAEQVEDANAEMQEAA